MSDATQLPATPIPGGFDVSGFGGHIYTCTNLPVYTIKFETNRERPGHSAAIFSMSTPLKHTALCTLMSLGCTIGVRQVTIEKTTWKGAFGENLPSPCRTLKLPGCASSGGRGQLWSSVTNSNLPPTPHSKPIPTLAPPQPYPPPHPLPTSAFPAPETMQWM